MVLVVAQTVYVVRRLVDSCSRRTLQIWASSLGFRRLPVARALVGLREARREQVDVRVRWRRAADQEVRVEGGVSACRGAVGLWVAGPDMLA